jgi:hypothetical protein
MAGVKITKFLGEAPKIASELLPETAAGFAFNTKLYSGDLIPFNSPSKKLTLPKTGTIKTIHPMDDGVGGFKWLHWLTDVDIARAPLASNATQRIYYTGDSEPRVTNYSMATTGGTNYPIAYYTLGLPTPLVAPTVAAASFTTLTISTRARDAGNTATIVTSAAHGLASGANVTITAAADTTFNLTNAQITVVNTTTFTYYCPGAAVTAVADAACKVDLSGGTQRRTYVYTWVSDWEEESVPSPASTELYIKEGQTVTVSALPSVWPVSYTGTYQTQGSSIAFSTVARTSNVTTVVTTAAHGLVTGDRVQVSGAGDASFNVTNINVTKVNDTTFTYDNPGSNVTTTSATGVIAKRYTLKLRLYRTVSSASGSAYYKVADIPLGQTTYTDTSATNTLVTILPSLYYDQPASNMQGIRSIHNSMMVGFFGNTVCFSEPGQPHAWPIKYRQTLDSEIVAVENVGQTIVVLTKRNPWVVQGTTPATMSKTRMDYTLTCTSKRGVVNMGFGLVFPTPGGLAVYSAASGGDLLTKSVHDWDTWRVAVDSNTLVAKQYNGRYIATSSKGSFLFERNDQIGGYLVELSQTFTAGYYDQLNAVYYYVFGQDLYQWDDPTQPYMTMDWKSKTMVIKEPKNLGAARIIADFGLSDNDAVLVAQNEVILANNQAAISGGGTLGGWAQSVYGAVGVNPDGTAIASIPAVNTDSVPFGGSVIESTIPVNAAITFELYADRELIFSRDVYDTNIFRLPSGYRTETYEARIYGRYRVHAVHLAETPYGLKQV